MLYNLISAIAMAFSLNTQVWKDSLSVVLFGMIGIFIVIGVIILVTYALNKMTSNKKDE